MVQFGYYFSNSEALSVEHGSGAITASWSGSSESTNRGNIPPFHAFDLPIQTAQRLEVMSLIFPHLSGGTSSFSKGMRGKTVTPIRQYNTGFL